MSKPKVAASSVRSYLRRLENPYAAEQVVAAADPYVQSQNPQAFDYYRGNEADATAAMSASATQTPVALGNVTKAEFRRRCRQIFAQYVPPAAKGRLRDHYLAFIDNNDDRPGPERFQLLAELGRYDLGDTPGIRPHFNRERDELTAEKLAAIEALVPRSP